PGVDHPERLEDALPQHRGQIPAGCPRQEDPEHLARRVVEPLLTRLAHEWQRAERADPPVDVVGHGGPRWTADALEPQLRLGPLDRVAAGWRHHGAEAEPVAEEVLEGDRPVGWDGVIELGV